MTSKVPPERVLLVGFMGAGKTTVGEALARALGWRFIDFDEEIERRSAMSIPAIFEHLGEAAFREMEAGVADVLLAESRVVLASGGGWAARSGGLSSVPPGTMVVWLEVSAEEAVRRASAHPDRRPLLAGPDPISRAREMLQERSPRYADADWRVDTERTSVEHVTARILKILRDIRGEANTE